MKRIYKKYLIIHPKGDERFILDFYTKKLVNFGNCLPIVKLHNKKGFPTKEILLGYTHGKNVIQKIETILVWDHRLRILRRASFTLYIHKNNNQVAYNEIDDIYLLKKDMIKLITKYDPQTQKCVLKSAAMEAEQAVPININGIRYYTRNVESAKELGFEEALGYGVFVPKGAKLTGAKLKYYKFPYPEFDKTNQKIARNLGALSPTYLLTEGKRYTFGIEIETISGYVPQYISKDLNMDCQYDGSIEGNRGEKAPGGEYTTGVLRGDYGFKHLAKIMYELSKRCTVNNSCSVHVHLGNLPFTKEFMVHAYKLFKMIEEETFDMMPPSRRDREHCAPIKEIPLILQPRGIAYKVMIDRTYSKIIEILSCGSKLSRSINKNFNHPRGERCGFDRSTPRYWWVNFIPAVFNLKGKENYTIEVRNHSGTLDFEKVKNWTLIVMGIVSFIENNKKTIASKRKITLREIMETEFPKTGKYLADYIDARKEYFIGGRALIGRLNEEKEYTKACNTTKKMTRLSEIILP